MPESANVNSLFHDWPAYGLSYEQKNLYLLPALQQLTDFHYKACPVYSRILQTLNSRRVAETFEQLPFIPVRLFKHERLLSVPQTDIVKTMTSSGTSGQNVSQIFLDKETSSLQIKVLSRIMANFIGPKRVPMLVIDCRATVSNRLKFSARTAGILGFSMFGRDVEYALDDDMTPNISRIEQFVKKHEGAPILLFGFTFIIWQHMIRYLEDLQSVLPLDNGILVHGGGWKQLQSQAVDSVEFKSRLAAVTSISAVHNYYGMVEQTGSIFMECESGHLHASAWSEVIIRDPLTFEPLPDGEKGLIQLLSLIPRSYPGHSLLSEDEGVVLGVDSCPCGRLGTYFKVFGRIQNAETRGCSDTYSR